MVFNVILPFPATFCNLQIVQFQSNTVLTALVPEEMKHQKCEPSVLLYTMLLTIKLFVRPIGYQYSCSMKAVD